MSKHRGYGGYGVELVSKERLTNSKNGNPRYAITYLHDDGTIGGGRTGTDSASGYEVQNVREGDRIAVVKDGRGSIVRVQKWDAYLREVGA